MKNHQKSIDRTRLYSKAQAARVSGLTLFELTSLVRSGRLKIIVLAPGGRPRITGGSLADFMAEVGAASESQP